MLTQKSQDAVDAPVRAPPSLPQHRGGSMAYLLLSLDLEGPSRHLATLSFPHCSGPESRNEASKALTSVCRQAVLFGYLLRVFVTRHSCVVASPTRLSHTDAVSSV